MVLQDSGNLILIGEGNEEILWQSFGHPSHTLLPRQQFIEDTTALLVDHDRTRRTNANITRKVHSVSLVSNSWNFYDKSKDLLWQQVISNSSSPDDFWIATLGSNGVIGFYDLRNAMGPVMGLVCLRVRCSHKWRVPRKDHSQENKEDENFLDDLPGMPTWFSYTGLSQATENYSRKVGQGGFGSVYLGVLPDGTQLAVKKLEGIGQGKKEFRAEICTIGSIHHVHLVRLKGFCAEEPHRLLMDKHMPIGSLDRWIFKNSD
ncbi:hypothetical protein CDL15_Pgr015102 [Punica granatum]|nr:hypothetical protein CDL15_Pgr015102 [Punica granatum]